VKIAVIQSTQATSVGSGIRPHNEKELMGDFCARLTPKLIAAGHDAKHFTGNTELGDTAARAAIAWHPQVAYIMHLDSAGGTPAAMLCYQYPRSLLMGLMILGAYCSRMGYRNKGGQLRIQGVNGGRVATLRICEEEGNVPTALFENGDMDAPDGYSWVKPEHRERASVAMCAAICAYAGGSVPPQKKKENDMQTWEYFGVKKAEKIDCWRARCNYFATTDGPRRNLRFGFVPKDSAAEPIWSDPQTNEADVQHDHVMQDILKQDRYKGLSGSYKLIIVNDSPIDISIREEVK
jgi:hypothetical protein